MKKVIHITLRSAFGICLLLSQLLSNRTTFFSENYSLLIAGILIVILAVILFISASKHLSEAKKKNQIAVTGPFRYIRHPIYTGIYVLTFGLGLIFFSWFWYIVMIIFIPLWYIECREEEKEMLNIHGQNYSDYQNRTKMFIPFIY
jgi:protein-S-isoprenylcysteine O-methyltransferase Ste14